VKVVTKTRTQPYGDASTSATATSATAVPAASAPTSNASTTQHVAPLRSATDVINVAFARIAFSPYGAGAAVTHSEALHVMMSTGDITADELHRALALPNPLLDTAIQRYMRQDILRGEKVVEDPQAVQYAKYIVRQALEVIGILNARSS
jgi:hypothetical protein